MDRLAQLHAMLDQDPRDVFCLYGIAQEHAKRGDVAAAVDFYDRALAVDPDYCYAYYHKARALEESGATDEATATLRSGLQRAKASGDAHAEAEIAALLDELT
jgi:tetratricopeptide (TPR) repeat protein